MLTDSENSILENTISIILKSPEKVTRKDFNDAYNCVYLHCSTKSENYVIKGEDIYCKVEKILDQFSQRIVFIGSCSQLAEQIHSFRQSVDVLSKLLCYLERFYIKTSMLNSSNTKKIQDLFYYKIYYNFIYRAEASLLDVIFLEIETLRKYDKQDISNLKVVIGFYLESLRRNGLETNMSQFYKKYMTEFLSSYDSKCSIRQLVRRIHLEVFISTNVFNDHSITKEIIQCVMDRKDEIMKYAFHKIEKFDKLKHIYAIINKMPESGRCEFKQRYESFAFDLFNTSNSFASLYSNYSKVIQQIKLNKMGGFVDLADECLKSTFKEKSNNEQLEIYDGTVSFIDKEFCKISTGFTNEELSSECITIDDKEVLFNFFAIISDDRLIDKYVSSVQLRLINGYDPGNEAYLMEFLLKRVGLGAISRLKNSIFSFLDKTTFQCMLNDRSNEFTASLIKVTKGFWNVERTDLQLNHELKSIENEILNQSELEEKTKLEFNYRLSPVIFELNGTRYKLPTDVFSIYYNIVQNKVWVSHEELKTQARDVNFDANISLLLNSGLISQNAENPIEYCANNKYSDQPFCDLFTKKEQEVAKKDLKTQVESKNHIIESRICSLLKKKKFMPRISLFTELEADEIEVEAAMKNLISKGYLEIINENIHYIP